MKKLTIFLIVLIIASLFSGCSVRGYDYGGVDDSLINENASPNAKALYAYLLECYGYKTFTGQYIDSYMDYSKDEFKVNPIDPESPMTVLKAYELQAVHQVTNSYPAVLGLDIDVCVLKGDDYSIRQAIEWHELGGIVTICWHWYSPNKEGRVGFYTEESDFNLKKTLNNKDGEDYKSLIESIDELCEAMKPLSEADVPILWRPLHEASGGWFWWGDSGKAAYFELWDLLYYRMTDLHELNNLIWIANAQKTSWYVSDDKCDMIGYDVYYRNENLYNRDKASSLKFKKVMRSSHNKMIAMTENGYVPDFDKMDEKGAKWLFYCTWCREWVCEYDEEIGYESLKPVYSSNKTVSAQELKRVFENKNAITLCNIKDYTIKYL